MPTRIPKKDNELTPEQYRVMREKGTEVPFSGEYVHTDKSGMYVCAACGHELFASDMKFDSGSGWPSFTAPAGEKAVATQADDSHGMQRTEVTCRNCGAHLGHVFDDGPDDKPRYCINSVALELEQRSSSDKI